MSEPAPASVPARSPEKAEPRPSGILGAGLLSALLYAVTLFVVVPVAIVSPFPLLLQRLRRGPGAAVLATLVAVGAIALLSPANAGFFLLVFVLPAMLIPEAMARGRGLLRGCGWAFAAISSLI